MSTRMKLFTSLVNISEARAWSTIKLLEQSARDVSSHANAALLHTFSDLEYNRTVFTLAGDRDGLSSCIIEMCTTALRNIDLKSHEGIHPRGGVIDLIPVHPLVNTSLEEAGSVARELANALRKEGVSCFLYGAADEQGRSLVDRRKGLGWFKNTKLPENPSSGWTAVGATPYVLNCNVTIHTKDMAMARRIAKAVRRPGQVEAMAFPHGDGIEIACNLTALDQVPPEQIISDVTDLAGRFGVGIVQRTVIGHTVDRLIDLATEALGIHKSLG